MAFDPTKPASNEYERNFPAQAQANWAALQSAINAEHQDMNSGSDGIHQFPVVGSNPTGLEGRIAIVNNVLYYYSNGVWRTAVLTDESMVTSDVATNNVSTSKHGFVPKAPNDVTKFLNGLGAFSVPPYPTMDIQIFTGNGTWTKPTGARMVMALCIGAGGGGGSGKQFASGTRPGGGGGGGGASIFRWFMADDLGATVSVTVGTGGAGGVTTGQNGNDGGFSQFGTYVAAGGGGYGLGGGASNSTGGGGGGRGTSGAGNTRGGPDYFGAALALQNGIAESGAVGAVPGSSLSGGCGESGGGGGGGSDSSASYIAGGGSMFGGGAGGAGGTRVTSTDYAAGAGGLSNSYVLGGGGAAGSAGGGGAGGAGTQGANSGNYYRGGAGGGGGGCGGTSGGAGGAGGIPGGGGGGGGGSTSSTVGAGGVGARGQVLVCTFF